MIEDFKIYVLSFAILANSPCSQQTKTLPGPVQALAASAAPLTSSRSMLSSTMRRRSSARGWTVSKGRVREPSGVVRIVGLIWRSWKLSRGLFGELWLYLNVSTGLKDLSGLHSKKKTVLEIRRRIAGKH